ncbi:hypothetical protein Hanom_Chr14g01311261 [Helianthus anomalus]
MAAIPWMQEEDIALCESWVEALSHYTPRNRSSCPFWGRILQHFSIGDHTRTVDAPSSRFRTIPMDRERFEQLHTAVEHQGGDFGEDDTIQVALINYLRLDVNSNMFQSGKSLSFLYKLSVFLFFILCNMYLFCVILVLTLCNIFYF